MAKIPKIHYSGGIVYSNGNRLPGWPCCGTGEFAELVKHNGNQTTDKNRVTCKNCIKLIEKQEAFKIKYSDIWEEQRKKGYCL